MSRPISIGITTKKNQTPIAYDVTVNSNFEIQTLGHSKRCKTVFRLCKGPHMCP